MVLNKVHLMHCKNNVKIIYFVKPLPAKCKASKFIENIRFSSTKQTLFYWPSNCNKQFWTRRQNVNLDHWQLGHSKPGYKWCYLDSQHHFTGGLFLKSYKNQTSSVRITNASLQTYTYNSLMKENLPSED